MKQYLVLYHAPIGATEKMKTVSPEEAKKGMEPWMSWAQKCGSHLVTLGAPLASGINISKSGVTDSQRNVCGYSILQAESIDEAKKLVVDHPHLSWMDSCEVEVHEMLPLPGK